MISPEIVVLSTAITIVVVGIAFVNWLKNGKKKKAKKPDNGTAQENTGV